MSVVAAAALGCALGVAATAVAYRKLRTVRSAPPEALPPTPAVPVPCEVDLSELTSVECVAARIGDRLADLAAGVEGHAELLCEVIGQPALVAGQAQSLWTAVRQLRLFSEKVVFSSRVPTIRRTPTDVRALLESLQQELEDYAAKGLRIYRTSAALMPPAAADRDTLRHAVLFLVDALLDLEPDAQTVLLEASTHVDEDRTPQVEIEIRVESADVPRRLVGHTPGFALGYAAARNLLQALGAGLALEFVPGLCTTVRLQLAATAPNAAPTMSTPAGPTAAPHPFGGILVVGSDPTLRTFVAREMEKTGRRIFACPDGQAARSLLLATPERFELLIVDGADRSHTSDKLADDAAQANPGLKVLWLATPPLTNHPDGDPLDARAKLHKPFGVPELRERVGVMLGYPTATRAGG